MQEQDPSAAAHSSVNQSPLSAEHLPCDPDPALALALFLVRLYRSGLVTISTLHAYPQWPLPGQQRT